MKKFVFLVFLIFVACNDDCVTESTRCNGDVVEICNSNGKWEESVDCASVSDGLYFDLTCSEDVDGEHACLMSVDFDGGFYDYDGGF